MRLIDADNINYPKDEQYKSVLKRVIECQRTVNEWIPCEEMMPEDYELYKDKTVINVLVSTDKGVVTKVQRIKIYYSNEVRWHWGRISNIIAWMPLPPSYKMDKK